MLSIISSLYKSEQHLPSFLKRLSRASEELSALGIAHECLLLPNAPSEMEHTLIDEYCAQNSNIRKIARELEPIYATWNAGVEAAQYDTVTFWNADDIRFVKGFVDGLKLINDGAEIVYFPFIYKRYVRLLGLKILAKVKIVQPDDYKPEQFIKEMQAGPFFMTAKSVFTKVGMFDPTFKIAGDFDFISRCAEKRINMVRSKTIAGIFTNDGSTISGSKDKRQQEENNRILSRVATFENK